MAVSDEAAVHTRTITWRDPLPGTGAAARISGSSASSLRWKARSS